MSLKGYAFVLISALFQGLGPVITALVIQELSPSMTVILRYIIAVMIITPIYYTKEEKKPSSRMVWLIGLMGVIGIGGGSFLYAYAIQAAGATVSLLVVKSATIMTIIMARIFFKESTPKTLWIAVVIMISGTYLLTGSVDIASKNAVLLGVVLSFGAALSWATVNILGKHIMKSESPLAVLNYRFLFGFLSLLLIAFLSGSFFEWTALSVTAIAGVLVLGIFCTLVGHYFYYAGLALVPVSRLTVVASTNIVFGAVFAFIILGEVLTLLQYLGGLLIVGSLYLVMIGKKKVISSIDLR